MSNSSQTKTDKLAQRAVSALFLHGQPTLYINPDLTGKTKSIAFVLFFSAVSYDVEILNEENRVVLWIDGNEAEESIWFSTLAKEEK